MSISDYVPRSDADFDVWQSSLVNDCSDNKSVWNIPDEAITSLKNVQNTWGDAWAKSSNKQNRTAADVTAKNVAREDFETFVRAFVAQWLAYNSKVTDSDRIRMGLTVKSDTHTPKPRPSTSPRGQVDFSVRRRHSIHFSDEAMALSKAKPDGVHGCEIYIKVGGIAPQSVSEMSFLGTCTATPHKVDFEGTQAGQTAYYWLRWVNTRGESGPWSDTVSATIVG